MNKNIVLLTVLVLAFTIKMNAQEKDSLTTTQKLKEVVITAERKGLDLSSKAASKLPLRNIENPQVLNTVNHLVIEQQGITNFPDILRNIPGVTKGWASVSPYYSSRGFAVRNYIRNGMVSYSASDMDPANIEQVDVVKGPVGSLFGSGLVSFGGMINRVTKKPFEEKKIDIGYQFGSYDLSRFTADVNLPLNEDKTALFRLKVAHTNDGSFQDSGFLKSIFIAPSFLYKVSDRLTLSLDAEIYEREGTSQPQFSAVGPIQSGNATTGASTPEELELDYKKSYSNNSIKLKDPARNFYAKIDYRFSHKWRMNTNIVNGYTANTGNYLTFGIPAGDSIIQRRISNYPTSKITTLQVQQNVNGNFKIGSVKNRLIAGVDYYRYVNNSESNTLNGRGGRPVFDELSINGDNNNYNAINPDLISEMLLGYSSRASKTTQQTLGVYLSDVINPIKRLSIMLSARFDRFFNEGTTDYTTGVTLGAYNQNSFSPKLGVVYEVIQNQVSIFANYNNGFQNVAPVTQPDGTISTFKPQYANQSEFGVKTDLLKNKLTATLSYYDILVKNTLRADVDDPTFTTQEVSNPVKGLN
ncbi:TonB-dependent siderophore receptor [Zhouia sp. PK063]|uniref:TonB-dependent siderophore receptor n=1 Tax=Zhouia sp. PK063 TaxID=3373602 RepID=UPI0037AE2CB7